MTRAGGEADKIGNRYESAWTVQQLLLVLAGRADSITVEDVGELAVGSEFTLRRENAIEVHQLKRQNGTANSWTVRALGALDIWPSAKAQVLGGREYHFVSTIPAVRIRNLCDRARRSGSFASFTEHWLTKELDETFTSLSAPEVLGSPLDAWSVLRGIWISWPDEDQVTNANAAIAGQLFDGIDGAAASSALGTLVVAHLGEELTRERIIELLPAFGLRLASPERLETTRNRVKALTDNWSSLIKLEQLEPSIPRAESGELAALCTNADERLFFLTGSAGGGKSVTLRGFAESMRASGAAVLAFRLDRLPRFWSTQEMGERLG